MKYILGIIALLLSPMTYAHIGEHDSSHFFVALWHQFTGVHLLWLSAVVGAGVFLIYRDISSTRYK